MTTVGFISPSLLLDILSSASVLILAAAGLSLVFGYMNLLNFAHGAFYMLGGYALYYVVQLSGNFWLGLILAPFIVGGGALLLEVSIIKRTYDRDLVTQVLVTLGLSLMIEGAILFQFGSRTKGVSIPNALSGSVDLFGITYPVYDIMLIFVGTFFIGLVWIGLERTMIGLVIRSSLSDRKITQALGYDIYGYYTWFLAGSLAITALAGALTTPLRGIGIGTAPAILIDTFVVVVVGGIGSFRGTILAGLIVASVDVLVARYISVRLSGLTVFIILVLVIVWRPRGLLGKQGVHD
jgi:branched-subunit amino acid ABC-type transport system permease component